MVLLLADLVVLVEEVDGSGPPKASPGAVDRRRGVGCETSVWKTERKTLFLRVRTRDAVMVAASSQGAVNTERLSTLPMSLLGVKREKERRDPGLPALVSRLLLALQEPNPAVMKLDSGSAQSTLEVCWRW